MRSLVTSVQMGCWGRLKGTVGEFKSQLVRMRSVVLGSSSIFTMVIMKRPPCTSSPESVKVGGRGASLWSRVRDNLISPPPSWPVLAAWKVKAAGLERSPRGCRCAWPERVAPRCSLPTLGWEGARPALSAYFPLSAQSRPLLFDLATSPVMARWRGRGVGDSPVGPAF